ncbi:MAG: Calx-beta domain-containing protein [Pyrinomonadaceae bacterium]
MNSAWTFFRVRPVAAAIAAALLFAAAAPALSAAEVCRLPSASIITQPNGRSSAGSIFSSLSRSSFSSIFTAGTVQFSDPSYTIGEGGVTATIIVTRSGDLEDPVMVNYATSNGTATAGQDYGHVTGTFFWANGDGDPKGFTIPITDDSVSEGSETVNITLSGPVGDISIGSPAQAVLTIVDNETGLPALSVADVTRNEGNSPNTLDLTVTLSSASTQPVTVNYSTADGSATSPSDYVAASGQVVFAPGETSRPISININGDGVVEPDETFTVNLSSPTNAVIADGSATVTLVNDDSTPTPTPTPTPGSGSVQFSSTAYSVNESVLAATITVTRTGSGSGAVSVNYATSNGTAVAGEDYTGTFGTLTWANGDLAAKTFIVQVADDTVLESNETVNLALSSPSGTVIGAPGNAVLTIIDNDATPEISINNVTQPEGNELNQLAFTVTLSSPSQQTVTMLYSTENGTATGGEDYVTVPNTLLTFDPGEVVKQIPINVLGDFVVEPDETFLLNITSATNADIVDSQGVATLLNDDAPGTIQFQAENYTVNESGGEAAIAITRTGGLSQGVSVRFVTVDGTALAGEDYVNTRTFVTFAPDQAVAMINVPINNDSVHEANETVNLALESPTGGAVIGSPANAILTITDNDGEPVLSVNDVTKNEGNSGSTAFTFTVSLAGTSSGTVTVAYETADGTALSPGDYASIPQGTLTFEPGETTKQVTVQVAGDFTNEPSETFFVQLSSPLGALIGDGQGQGTIVNDDLGGAFRFTSAQYSVSEAGSFVAITVQRTGGLSAGASVDYSTANGTAIAGLDYTAVSGTLAFDGGQTTHSFIVPIANDGVNEPDESFSVILSNATGGGSTLGVPNTAAVFITEIILPPQEPTPFDYDGDGRADLSVRRPSNNIWYLRRTSAGYTAMQWGVAGDRMAPADYDGDGKTDVAVFRPADGKWYTHLSQSQTFQTISWGANGDLPVPADRDADGRADLVLFRPSNNTWYTRFANGTFNTFAFGAAGDRPVVGDFDADGRGDLAVFRPGNSTWYILRSTLGFLIQTWGEAGDIPAPADFDGDGAVDRAVFRPSTGQWFRSRTTAGFDSLNWGEEGDIPVPADYDGDGRSDVAVFRPSNGKWYIIGSTAGILIEQFGITDDVPTPSAFIY